jgi:ABC-type transport system involved in cytochrome bd biosynthesis fused ATPase/permease subunit
MDCTRESTRKFLWKIIAALFVGTVFLSLCGMLSSIALALLLIACLLILRWDAIDYDKKQGDYKNENK